MSASAVLGQSFEQETVKQLNWQQFMILVCRKFLLMLHEIICFINIGFTSFTSLIKETP